MVSTSFFDLQPGDFPTNPIDTVWPKLFATSAFAIYPEEPQGKGQRASDKKSRFTNWGIDLSLSN